MMFFILAIQVKCHRYWPNNGANVYGNYKVTLHKEEQLTNYCMREFIIEQVMYIICYQLLWYISCFHDNRFAVLRTMYV